jgi:hypothetical protein
LTVPAFWSAAPTRVSVLPLPDWFRFNTAPLAICNAPPPEIVPPTHVIELFTVNVPAVLSVAPWSVRLPLTDEDEAIARKPFVRSSDAWELRLLTESAVDEECVTVMSLKGIDALSPEPGTPPVHMAGLSQSPLTSLAQLTVESNLRDSSRITAGCNTRRRAGDELWMGRRVFRRMVLLLG